jgi:hypothetical protein
MDGRLYGRHCDDKRPQLTIGNSAALTGEEKAPLSVLFSCPLNPVTQPRRAGRRDARPAKKKPRIGAGLRVQWRAPLTFYTALGNHNRARSRCA